jgi:hypothetical protein
MRTDGRVAFFLLQANPSQDDALIEEDIVADFRRFADDNAGSMINEETPADPGTGMDFNTGEKPIDMGDKSCREIPVMAPEGMGDPVQPEGMESRVAGDYLQNAPGGGVLPENRLNIFSDPFYHFVNTKIAFKAMRFGQNRISFSAFR